jgi:hypothetical protein
MSGSSSNHRPRTAAFTVTVSGDPRFADTVRTLTRKAAEADGCAGADADRFASAVEHVLSTLLASLRAPSSEGALDLRFEPTRHAFRVEILVPARVVASSGGTLERSLAASGGLEVVRSLAPGAEFGETGAHQFCRLACRHAPGSTSTPAPS